MSLQDQLLKAGLVGKKQVQKANKTKHKTRKQQGKKPVDIKAEQLAKAQQAKAEKAEKDRELNRQKQLETERKALAAQVKQLIEAHRLTDGQGDSAYNFADGKLIKRIHIRDELVDQLSKGQLAVVRLNEGYELVPAKIAERIQQRDATSVVVLNQTSDEPDEDDPYADYVIPDDLMW